MSRPLTPKNEYMLTSSALFPADIITLSPVAPTSSIPPATTNASLLPCERRFLIRLVDDAEGRSRWWTTPEAARDAEVGSRFMPPYHPAALNVQVALQERATHDIVVRNHELNLRRDAEADRQKQREQTRPAFVAANAAEGTAHVQSELPTSPGGEAEGGEESGEEQGESDEEDDIDAESMEWIGASCQRCIEQKRRCNRRRPCQFCMQDGVGEAGCFLPRGSDSPEPAASLSRNDSQQPPFVNSAATVADDAGENAGSKRKRSEERDTSGKYQCPPVPLPAFDPFTPPPGTFPVPSAAVPPRSAFTAPPNRPAPPTFPPQPTRPAPPTAPYPSSLPPAPAQPARPTQATPSTLNTTNRRGGRRGVSKPKKPSSPRPYRGQNFLTEEQEKKVRAWDERHKDD